MRPVSRILAPWTRRLVYPAASTRSPVDPPTWRIPVDGAELCGWVVDPGRPRALLYLGGNAESIELRRQALSRHLPGHTSYLVAYRGYGASSGRPSEQALTEDVVRVHDLVAERHPGHAVDVVGRSLGTGVAVQLAVRRPIGRLVLVTPFDSAAGVATSVAPRPVVDLVLADRWDSAAVAPRITAPVLVVRAGRDEVILPARTGALIAALPPGAQVIAHPEADHSSIIDEPDLWPEVRDFLGRPD